MQSNFQNLQKNLYEGKSGGKKFNFFKEKEVKDVFNIFP